MNILLLTPVVDATHPALGFATRWIAAIARHAERVHVVAMQVGALQAPGNVEVYSLGKEKGHGKPRRAAEFYRHLASILLRREIDVCFSHMVPLFTVMAAPVLKARDIPIVMWYAHRRVSPLLKIAHRLSTRVVTSADTSYNYRGDKLVVLGQGIETGLYSPGDAAGVEGADDTPLLVSVGRISPIKDLLTLVRAVKVLERRGRNVRCAIVGGPTERDPRHAEEIGAEIDALGLAGKVRMAGPARRDEVVEWHRRCFAHVNLCPDGALDKAALEAMACGKPSIVANRGFMDVLGKWKDLLLFRHGDPRDLASAVERLLETAAADREAMGMDLRRKVVEDHDLDRLAERLMCVFREVSAPPRRLATGRC